MDAKLAKLLKQGTEAEARAGSSGCCEARRARDRELRALLHRVAAKSGFDLTRGDIALVHPEDLPETVQLMPRRDPVYSIAHPEVIKGRMLFVRKKLAAQYLEHAMAVH
jgi:hypothetical protein